MASSRESSGRVCARPVLLVGSAATFASHRPAHWRGRPSFASPCGSPPFGSGTGLSGLYPRRRVLSKPLVMKMTCTIEKALADAKALVERLREHDNAAEALIEQTTALNKRVEAMKQYQEEIQELNEVARHRPRSTLVMGIQQENRQIRELQQENKELRTSLEEHQSALELIMSKYREQMFRLLMARKKDDPSIIMKLKEQHSKELQVHVDQITEMAAVMRKAIEIDEKHGCKEQERIIQLEQENKGLREILQITRESFLNLKKEDASESTSLSGLVTSSDLSLRKS